jgi:hypothetical protein
MRDVASKADWLNAQSMKAARPFKPKETWYRYDLTAPGQIDRRPGWLATVGPDL